MKTTMAFARCMVWLLIGLGSISLLFFLSGGMYIEEKEAFLAKQIAMSAPDDIHLMATVVPTSESWHTWYGRGVRYGAPFRLRIMVRRSMNSDVRVVRIDKIDVALSSGERYGVTRERILFPLSLPITENWMRTDAGIEVVRVGDEIQGFLNLEGEISDIAKNSDVIRIELSGTSDEGEEVAYCEENVRLPKTVRMRPYFLELYYRAME
jgi:hypothetical protein